MKQSVVSWLFGFVCVRCKSEALSALQAFLYEEAIPNWGVHTEGEDTVLFAEGRDRARLEKYFLVTGISAELSLTGGLPALFLRYRCRVGLWIGVFLFFAIFFLSGKVVWEVRVTGNETISEREIIAVLEEQGLGVGSFIPSIDVKSVENRFLLASDSCSYISVNLNGSVANIRVIESKLPSEPIVPEGQGTNLVASYDAVIEELEIICGEAAVDVGKVVKRGELLVSGVSPGGFTTRLLHARGKVWGRVCLQFSEEISLVQTETVETGTKVLDFSINFFGKNIKFSKYTGKNLPTYDTIYKRDPVYLFGSIRLPISIEQILLPMTEERQVTLTEQEAVFLAQQRLQSKMDAVLSGADTVSKSYNGYFADGKYILECTVVCVIDIAKGVPFYAVEGAQAGG